MRYCIASMSAIMTSRSAIMWLVKARVAGSMGFDPPSQHHSLAFHSFRHAAMRRKSVNEVKICEGPEPQRCISHVDTHVVVLVAAFSCEPYKF